MSRVCPPCSMQHENAPPRWQYCTSRQGKIFFPSCFRGNSQCFLFVPFTSYCFQATLRTVVAAYTHVHGNSAQRTFVHFLYTYICIHCLNFTRQRSPIPVINFKKKSWKDLSKNLRMIFFGNFIFQPISS